MNETQRTCGDCGQCCRLRPVVALRKAENVRCMWRSFRDGCRVFGKIERPEVCASWNCGWLAGWFEKGQRPDRSGYVVDPVVDTVSFGPVGPGGVKYRAIQVWIEAKRPMAHRDPVLREWLIEQAKDKDILAIARCAGETTVLVPPRLSDTGHWRELPGRKMKPTDSAKVVREAIEENIKSAREHGRTAGHDAAGASEHDEI